MENKLDQPKMTNQARKGILLPYYFKIVGFALMILPLILGVIFKIIENTYINNHKGSIRVFMMSAFILGLLFIAGARDKIEDEFTISLRLRSVAFSTLMAVVKVIIVPMIDLVGGEPIGDSTNQELVMQMLITYLILFYLQKYGGLYFGKSKNK